jgi:hypothetical protein
MRVSAAPRRGLLHLDLARFSQGKGASLRPGSSRARPHHLRLLKQSLAATSGASSVFPKSRPVLTPVATDLQFRQSRSSLPLPSNQGQKGIRPMLFNIHL